MIKLNRKIRIVLCAVFIYFNPVLHASNFVCGQDLDGNGDIGGIGENASCQTIGTEQFCSVGAQNCSLIVDAGTKYYCSKVNDTKYDTMNACQYSCVIPTGELSNDGGHLQWTTVNYDRPEINDKTTINQHFGTTYNLPFNVSTHLINGVTYVRGLEYNSRRHNTIARGDSTIKSYKMSVTVGGPGQCKAVNGNVAKYTCPTAGNSCVDVNGTQKCSINSCIDLDVTPPEDVTPPSLTQIDDGKRDVDGACMEQALLFSGRNSSCKYSGMTKDCCKNTDVVYRDSSGSILSNTAKNVAMTQTYAAVSAAYSAYTASAATGATVATSSAAASSAAQSAFVGVDPYSVAIAIAIQVITKMISCGQQDTETAMLNGSGYCHFVGTFCSKEWSFAGCVQQSKSYCCFNSKLGRILQEQGRIQMGKGWGSAKSPSCGGFTANEFQSLDFNRIDLTEYYGDIQSKGDSLIQKDITDSVSDYYRQIRK